MVHAGGACFGLCVCVRLRMLVCLCMYGETDASQAQQDTTHCQVHWKSISTLMNMRERERDENVLLSTSLFPSCSFSSTVRFIRSSSSPSYAQLHCTYPHPVPLSCSSIKKTKWRKGTEKDGYPPVRSWKAKIMSYYAFLIVRFRIFRRPPPPLSYALIDLLRLSMT